MKVQDLIIKSCLLLLFLSAAVFQTEAQKKKISEKRTVRTAVTEANSAPVPAATEKDFLFVVRIDKDSNVTLNVQNVANSDVWQKDNESSSLNKFFKEFSRLQQAKTPGDLKNSLDPAIIVKADSSLDFGQIVEVIQDVRVSGKKTVRLEIVENLYATVPPKPDNKTVTVKPNPLFLLVTLEKDFKIRLNQDETGDFENISPLREKLREIFDDREKNFILREGTNEIEKTVVVKVPLLVKFNDLIRLVQSLAEAGASPIKLQIDDLEK